jgi:uncharacterized protein YuzE
MAKSIAEIKYDAEEDILSFWKGNPSQSSIEIGDFIIDIDSKGFVSGLEILNVSENLEMSREILGNIENASMAVVYKPGYVYILIRVKLKGKDKNISIPLTVDLGHKKVKREEIVFVR